MPEFWLDLLELDEEYIIYGRGKDDERIKHTTTGVETAEIAELVEKHRAELTALLWRVVGGRP